MRGTTTNIKRQWGEWSAATLSPVAEQGAKPRREVNGVSVPINYFFLEMIICEAIYSKKMSKKIKFNHSGRKAAEVKPEHGAKRPYKITPVSAYKPDFVCHVRKYIKFLETCSASKIEFFTLKCNKDLWSMDKVRKWASSFASHYLIVSSPRNGRHYHGLVFRDIGQIRYRKGVHLRVDPVGTCSQACFLETAQSPPVEFHKYVPGLVGALLLDVNRQIDGYKTSITKRHKAARQRKLKVRSKSLHLNRVAAYLFKNFYENSNPKYLQHLIVR